MSEKNSYEKMIKNFFKVAGCGAQLLNIINKVGNLDVSMDLLNQAKTAVTIWRKFGMQVNDDLE